jgi:predicted metal-dependent hydrolase
MADARMLSQLSKLHELEELLKSAAEDSRKQRWLVTEEAFLEARRVLIAACEKVERESARLAMQGDLEFQQQ